MVKQWFCTPQLRVRFLPGAPFLLGDFMNNYSEKILDELINNPDAVIDCGEYKTGVEFIVNIKSFKKEFGVILAALIFNSLDYVEILNVREVITLDKKTIIH